MTNCLSDETMAEIAAGTLGAEARGSAIGHVDECADCRTVLAQVLSDEPARGSAVVPPRASLAAGEQIGRYIVLDCIGAGSMGIVYTAHDPNLGRKVALKVLRSEPATSSLRARRRLLREAQAMARTSACTARRCSSRWSWSRAAR
jgi:hypothetical protein